MESRWSDREGGAFVERLAPRWARTWRCGLHLATDRRDPIS